MRNLYYHHYYGHQQLVQLNLTFENLEGAIISGNCIGELTMRGFHHYKDDPQHLLYCNYFSLTIDVNLDGTGSFMPYRLLENDLVAVDVIFAGEQPLTVYLPWGAYDDTYNSDMLSRIVGDDQWRRMEVEVATGY